MVRPAMAKKLLREAFDLWGHSLGFIVATVPDDFDMAKAPIPSSAPRELFQSSTDAMRALDIRPPTRPPG